MSVPLDVIVNRLELGSRQLGSAVALTSHEWSTGYKPSDADVQRRIEGASSEFREAVNAIVDDPEGAVLAFTVPSRLERATLENLLTYLLLRLAPSVEGQEPRQ
jgi:hypothetical protein